MKPINEMSMDELAEYAVTLDGWEWMDGVKVAQPNNRGVARIGPTFGSHMTISSDRPDLTDPATKGCVLAMVRKKWGHRFYVRPSKGNPKHWCAVCQDEERLIWVADGYPTEAHALIAALAKEKP
jgi:hypothetical protein